MSSPTDEMLLQALKDGNAEGLGTLYERYKTLLYNFFLKSTQDKDLSSDLLMETFERVYRYRNSFDPNKKVRPWIFQIASNLVKDHYKKSKRISSVDVKNVENQVNAEDDSEDASIRSQLLKMALSQLKPSERSIVSMYYLLEMSYSDIAESEGITVNNARIKVCRALKKLNDLLKNSGV